MRIISARQMQLSRFLRKSISLIQLRPLLYSRLFGKPCHTLLQLHYIINIRTYRLMVLNILVVLYLRTVLVERSTFSFILLARTQVEVVVNAVANHKDTEQRVKQGRNGGIVAVNVASLVATPQTSWLGRFNSTLGQAL